MEKEEKGGKDSEDGKLTESLHGVHVIEGIIQFLADRLVSQLLSVQFVWKAKGRQTSRGEADGA